MRKLWFTSIAIWRCFTAREYNSTNTTKNLLLCAGKKQTGQGRQYRFHYYTTSIYRRHSNRFLERTKKEKNKLVKSEPKNKKISTAQFAKKLPTAVWLSTVGSKRKTEKTCLPDASSKNYLKTTVFPYSPDKMNCIAMLIEVMSILPSCTKRDK